MVEIAHEITSLKIAQAQAKLLVKVLEHASDAEVRKYAHRALAQAYGRSLAAGKPGTAEVEDSLLAAGTPTEAVVAACYGLVGRRGLGPAAGLEVVAFGTEEIDVLGYPCRVRMGEPCLVGNAAGPEAERDQMHRIVAAKLTDDPPVSVSYVVAEETPEGGRDLVPRAVRGAPFRFRQTDGFPT